MTAVSTKLREARALIERGWCQFQLAHDAEGRERWEYIGTREDDRFVPVSWCAAGALKDAGAGALAVRAFREVVGTPISWNDAPERTQTDVLAAFDRAIELAEQEAR
jgi:hypothetical protein